MVMTGVTDSLVGMVPVAAATGLLASASRGLSGTRRRRRTTRGRVRARPKVVRRKVVKRAAPKRRVRRRRR